MTTLEGGARHNTITINAVGFAKVVDAFAAIKKLVYEERRISLKKLKEILLKDFEGHEAVLQMLLNDAPKYGNDDDYTDRLGMVLL